MKPVALWPHVCLVVASLAPSALAAPSTTSKPSSAASAAPSSASPATAADAQELAKLLATFDALWVDNKTYAEIEMKIVTKNYSRNLAMNYWGDGKDKSLIKISAPPKEKGVATLKVGNDVYNYLPKVARTIYYREPRDFSGKRIPSLVRVEPKTTDLSGESTEMRYVKINRKAALDADLFQLSTLTNQ